MAVLVTGGSSGIGLEVAKALCAKGARCTIIGSMEEKGHRAAQETRESCPGARVQFEQCDLTALRSVSEFARRWKERRARLDVLVMIAGTFLTPYQRTADGFEQTVASNYLGHFLLAHLLLPELQAGAHSRIVWMASAYEQLGSVNWDDIGGEFARDSNLGIYCSANLYSIMAAQEMQRRLQLQGSQLDVFSVQPGLVNSPLFSGTDWAKPSSWTNWLAARLFGQSPARGAISSVHCASSPEVQGQGWAYFGPPYLGLLALPVFNHWRWRPLNRWSRNADAQRRLYEETAKLLEEKMGTPLPNKLPASKQDSQESK